MEIIKNSGIYLVSSQDLSVLPTIDIVTGALEAGCRLVQLREKKMSKKELFELGLSVKKLTDIYGAVLIINDHIDIALALNADGVHLGLDDIPVNIARKVLGEEYIIGASTHNADELKAAVMAGADYVNIGPVFPTGTKPDHKAMGLSGIEEMLPFASVPYTFMGGIRLNNIQSLKQYQPAAAAMITEITRANNIKERVTQLLKVAG
ncbi:MAG: thiamine phosphate synthase [Oligoflexia bacterium]|nr:thiamine phosphate synthase [Oligoflexia bacterium]